MAPIDWIGTVESLIEICNGGEQGYREAARKTTRPDLKHHFETQSSTRAEFALELQRELSRLTQVNVHGSVAAALHRQWLDLLARFGGGDKGVLTAVREGEKRAMASYEDALTKPLPPQAEQLVRNQLENIRKAYNELAVWQTALAA
jgi:uncharacterized protein (TIGR02284 family)